MWPSEGAASNPNGDSEAKKSDQGCKENKTNLVREIEKEASSSTPCPLMVYDVAQRGSYVETQRGFSSKEI